MPITKFMYPALIPIIPGDMLYYTAVCLVSVSNELSLYAGNLVLSMLGLALGTMLMPVLLNSKGYFRRMVIGPADNTVEEIERK